MPQVPTTNATPATEASAPVATETKETKARTSSAKKTAGKKKAAKKGAKKAAGKKAPKTPKAPGERKLNKTQVAILKVLNKTTNGLTRKQISDKLETFIGNNALGHVDNPEKTVETSLLGRKFISVHAGDPAKLKDGTYSESPGASVLKITASGKKALESLS